MRRLNRKRKAPTERSTNVKLPRVKDEKVAAKSLILLSETAKGLEMNTDDLLVAHALCSLGDMSSARAQTSPSNEVDDFKFECSVESDQRGKNSERQELKTVSVQKNEKRSQTWQQVNRWSSFFGGSMYKST